MAGTRANGSEARVTDDFSDGIPVVITEDGGIREADSGDEIVTIEPSTISFEGDSGEPPKRRGRKPGSKNAVSRKSNKESASDLTGILLSAHMMLAAITKIEELEIEKEEAERLGKAIQRVNEVYGGMVLPEKTAAWINLSFALGQVYGPRLMVYKMRTKKEEKEAKEKSSQVFQQSIM